MTKLKAQFTGFDIIQTSGISVRGYIITVSKSTALVYRDGVNVCSIYPWAGMDDDDFLFCFGDEFDGLNNDEIKRISAYIRNHVEIA